MYVITGATGNTGGVIAKTLLGLGQKVRAIGRNPEKLQLLGSQGAETVVADVNDSGALADAFSGAKAVFVMIPPSQISSDYRADQDAASASMAAAIKSAGVEYAVSLSSVGADKPSLTGPIVGLHVLENRLNEIDNLNVLHLRAAYFMENTLAQIRLIKMMGITAGPLRSDLKIPMITTRDIATVGAQSLLSLEFSGKQPKELLGERDLSMNEVASVIGQATGKPNLKYMQAPDQQVKIALTQQGMSENVADLLLEMASGLNSAHVRPLEARSPENTTETSFETFVAEVFAPAFQAA